MVRATVPRRSAVALVGSLSCVGLGCGDDDRAPPLGPGTTTGTGIGTGSTGTGTNTSTGGSAGSGGTGGEASTVIISLRLWDVESSVMVDGVEVCQDGANPQNCTTSSSSGEVFLFVTANAELGLRLQGVGFANELFAIETAATDLLQLGAMWPAAFLAGIAQDFGVTIDPTGGVIAFGYFPAPSTPSGVTASIAPASGVGPFYLDASLNALPQATEIPPEGTVLFFNVDPGVTTASFAPAVAGCAFHELAWGSEASSTTAPIEADVLTGLASVLCQ